MDNPGICIVIKSSVNTLTHVVNMGYIEPSMDIQVTSPSLDNLTEYVWGGEPSMGNPSYLAYMTLFIMHHSTTMVSPAHIIRLPPY